MRLLMEAGVCAVWRGDSARTGDAMLRTKKSSNGSNAGLRCLLTVTSSAMEPVHPTPYTLDLWAICNAYK
jgi:hypothetical protein